jgi:small subunit ribosomal protein S20
MAYKSKVRTAVKKFLHAAEQKDTDSSRLLGVATSLLHKGVSKGILHGNTASRTIGRLSQKLPSA